MWDPTRNWGMPVELFLRRIGSFNPLFFMILVLNKIGVPYILSYLIFLGSYYLLGMIGFYLLARRILKDSRCAYLAYVLLMFSALGTKNFDSYAMLTFVPMVWFFYFLINFSQQPARPAYRTGRPAFLGMTFTAMILVTTYIPFYFLTIFLFFVAIFSLIYPGEFKAALLRYRGFVSGNRIFVCLCLVVFILTLIPGALFYHEGIKGELAFPGRHENSAVENTLEVQKERSRDWSIVEELMFAGYYTDLHKYEFGIFYMPVFAYVLLFLGMVTTVNRRLVLLCLWALCLFLIGSPNITPLYSFLYDHIFFFKYFRNLHYFLWLGLLPIFVLYVAEQFRLLLNCQLCSLKEKIGVLIFICLVHVAFLAFIYFRGNALATSYGVIFLSWLFFTGYFLGWPNSKSLIVFCFILILGAAQAVEVYHYLSQRAWPYDPKDPYRYLTPYVQLSLPTESERQRLLNRNNPHRKTANVLKTPSREPPEIYVGVSRVNFLLANIDYNVFADYVAPQFLIYDRVETVDEKKWDLKRIERALAHFENVAFISPGDISFPVEGKNQSESFASQAQIITGDSPELKVLDYGVNFVKLKTRFATRKFLVYNDGFHSGWQSFNDGHKTQILLANVAFKGIWLSPGEHIVDFRYGARWKYFFNFFLMVVFNLIFGWLVFLWAEDFLSRVPSLGVEAKC